MQDYSSLQWLIRFEDADVIIVARHQKIDSVLEAMSHSSLLAKNCFRSAVSSQEGANEDIHLFRHFIKNVLWLIFPIGIDKIIRIVFLSVGL